MPLDLPTPGGDIDTWGTQLVNALDGTGPGTLADTYAGINAPAKTVAPGVTLYNPKGLRRWSVALADAVRGVAVASFYGDSIIKGVGSDGNSGDTNLVAYGTDGWIGQMRSLMAAQYGDPGEGHVGIIEGGGRWVFAGGAAATASIGPYENGGRATGTTQTITINLSQCTQVDIYCWDGGNGTATYSVDGAAAVNFSAGTGTSTALTWTKTSITGLADTTHTLVITGPLAGNVYVGAVIALRKTTGVQIHRFGNSGNSTANLVGQDASLNGNTSGQARMLEATARVPASNLLVLSFGVNDWANQDSTSPTLTKPGTTPTTYKANLKTSIDKAVANGACVLLLGEPRAVPVTRTHSEADYYDKMRELALENTHVAFMDMADLWGTAHSDGETDGLFTTSSVHPTRRGHGSIARLVHRVLTTPFGVNAPTS